MQGTGKGWIYTAGCRCGWRKRVASHDEMSAATAEHLHVYGVLTREERLAARDKVHVFSNGTEHATWEEANCFECRKGYDEEPQGWKCPIQKAVGEAMFDDDAAMDRELAIRGGLVAGIPCPEREPIP